MDAIQSADFEVLEHPPYSPDLALSNFYLFQRLTEYLKRQEFEDDVAGAATGQTFLVLNSDLFPLSVPHSLALEFDFGNARHSDSNHVINLNYSPAPNSDIPPRLAYDFYSGVDRDFD
ncbi:hypothetical protein EVAR_15843_1 [Eumeta japonica]|uniref:Histone-lysine N-methyltransferase SETMAR n=1 Tax=Eumeta variegata TaxID=151549 RepID=A0A4C1UEU9_EUMVA|nr:hypothetical protein EVAR_15843_1 [Eumeta japonica]